MLSLRFSTPPQNADATILDLLARSGGASRAVTVVTADRDLAWEAAKLGASVVSPESWEALKTGTGRGKRARSGRVSSEKPQVTARDVDYWLEIFGEERGEKE